MEILCTGLVFSVTPLSCHPALKQHISRLDGPENIFLSFVDDGMAFSMQVQPSRAESAMQQSRVWLRSGAVRREMT